jgi:hypothetical protein
MTKPQRRLLDLIKAYGEGAEYWPIVNDWVQGYEGPARSLALRNINRTVEALIKSGHITIDDNGYFVLTSCSA